MHQHILNVLVPESNLLDVQHPIQFNLFKKITRLTDKTVYCELWLETANTAGVEGGGRAATSLQPHQESESAGSKAAFC